MRWTLVQEYADRLERKRLAIDNLVDIEGRLLRAPPRPNALAARRAISNLEEHQMLSLSYLVDVGLRRPQLNIRPFGRAAMSRWLVRAWICQVKAVLAPLASIVIQGAYRRHLRRQRALHAIQRAAFRHLYMPGGWAERQSIVGLTDVLQTSQN